MRTSNANGRRPIALIAFAGLAVLALGASVASCWRGAGGGCLRGETCECSGGPECYLGCEDDGCNLLCHDMDHCGGVCGHDCGVTCFGTNECSAACGDNCLVTCNDTPACGALCGAGCHFECRSVDRCGVRAGPGSVISCNTVSSCVVECEGTCQVSCIQVGRPCDISITCPPAYPLNQCSNTVFTCGPC